MTKLEPTRTSSDLTATERLCELLDERGVEYERTPWSCGAAVWWRDSSGTMWRAHDNEEDELLSFYAYNSVTPEQAIAATVGRDNAGRYVGLRQGKYWERTENSDYYCGGCGWKVTDHDSYCPECGGALHKAALDSSNCTNSERTETCKVDVLNTGDCAGYECSEYIMYCNGCGHEFGYVLYNEDGDVWMSEPPKYCPNCGRRVAVVAE